MLEKPSKRINAIKAKKPKDDNMIETFLYSVGKVDNFVEIGK